MIGVDTNVLVRFLVRDDEEQHAKAKRLLARGSTEGASFFLSDVVLAELVWVLSARYAFDRRAIAVAIRALLEAEHVVVESIDTCLRALARYQGGRGGFADYLIAERGRQEGCPSIATFDRALLAEEEFVEPE